MGVIFLIDFRLLEIELPLLCFVFGYLPFPSEMSKKRSVLHFEKSDWHTLPGNTIKYSVYYSILRYFPAGWNTIHCLEKRTKIWIEDSCSGSHLFVSLLNELLQSRSRCVLDRSISGGWSELWNHWIIYWIGGLTSSLPCLQRKMNTLQNTESE